MLSFRCLYLFTDANANTSSWNDFIYREYSKWYFSTLQEKMYSFLSHFLNYIFVIWSHGCGSDKHEEMKKKKMDKRQLYIYITYIKDIQLRAYNTHTHTHTKVVYTCDFCEVPELVSPVISRRRLRRFNFKI